jgi:hypothetical protein
MAKPVKLSIAVEAEKADDEIMALCRPERMTPAEAKDFLEQVIERCVLAIECLVEENPELENR